jgi:hypothetical protein
MGKERAGANLRPKLLPGVSVRAEILRLNEQNKVRIPHVHHSSRNIADAWHLDRTRHHTWNPHLAFDQIQRVGSLNHVASAQATMGTQRNILPAFTPRQPSGNATRTVAGELRLATIGVEETQEQIAIGPTLQKLDAVGADTGISRTELACELSMAALGQRPFNDEEIVAAGMRFDEGNHDASIVPQWFFAVTQVYDFG